MTPLLQSLLVLVSMAGAAFFAGIETGVISIHRMRLRHFVRKGSPGSGILQSFLDEPDRLLGTTLVGTNVFVVVISVVSASLAVDLIGEWGEPVATAVMAVMVLVFCEYLPKAWFHSRPLERCRRFAHVLRLSELVLAPVSRLVIWITRALVPGPARSFSEPAPFVTKEDLKVLAHEGEKDGVLSPRERSMIHRVIDLSRKRARDIMVPATQMSCVDSDTDIAGFFEKARATNFSRMPMVERESGRTIGVVNLFYVLSSGTVDTRQPVSAFVRPPLFVPENMPVDDILPRMRRFRQPMCLVTDGDGTVTGLLTTEDILRVIVGRL